MQPDKLVMMANQIAKAFAVQGERRAVPQIADHIGQFWDPRMRRQIAAHLAQGGDGLDPLALAALATLGAQLPESEPTHRPGARA